MASEVEAVPQGTEASIEGGSKLKASAATTHSNLVPRLFDDCQRTIAMHRKSMVVLRQALLRMVAAPLDEAAYSAFVHQFCAAVNRLLAVFKREPAVERLVQFVTAFIAAVANDTELIAARCDFASDMLRVRSPYPTHHAPGSSPLTPFIFIWYCSTCCNAALPRTRRLACVRARLLAG